MQPAGKNMIGKCSPESLQKRCRNWSDRFDHMDHQPHGHDQPHSVTKYTHVLSVAIALTHLDLGGSPKAAEPAMHRSSFLPEGRSERLDTAVPPISHSWTDARRVGAPGHSQESRKNMQLLVKYHFLAAF